MAAFKQVLATAIFALIALLLAVLMFTGFSGVEEKRAQREYWKSQQHMTASPKNKPMIIVQQEPRSVHVVPIPSPQAHVAPSSPGRGAIEPGRTEPPVTPKTDQLEFLEAAQAGDVPRVQRLLPEIGTNALSLRNGILRAARNGHLDVMKAILEYNGAITDLIDRQALLDASEKGHFDVVKVLVDAGADANVKTANGETPLIVASAQGHTEIVKMLLKSGADVNAKCTYGTPLILAAANLEMVRLLLNAGADVNAKAPNGQTALSKARSQNLSRTAKLLEKYGAK